MAAITVDATGIDRVMERLRKIANPDPRPLMATWQRIMERDNREGVLRGTDKDDMPMAPVTYRPKGTVQKKLTDAQRNTTNRRARKGHFAGLGPHMAGLHNNLASAEYRHLTGPPLAPRGRFSRVITNFKTQYGREGNIWFVEGAWDEVVNVQGKMFLHYHFDGASGGGKRHNVVLPRRDLRGVRPGGMEKAREALRQWAWNMVRTRG